jgi:hypothetical protein
MPRLYRSEEPHSDLGADGPYHLDREPVTGQQFNRYMFSDCDPEGAVDAKAAPQVIHDYDASTEPIMAVQERGNANRPSNALPTFLQDLKLPRHGAPSIGTRPRGGGTRSNARVRRRKLGRTLLPVGGRGTGESDPLPDQRGPSAVSSSCDVVCVVTRPDHCPATMTTNCHRPSHRYAVHHRAA